MDLLADFDFNQHDLHEGIIAVTQHFRDDFPAQAVRDQLATLAKQASEEINERYSDMRLEKLLDLFYGKWQFRTVEGVYQLSDALQIDKTLQTRRGNAMSLGIIFLALTCSLKIPLMPVLFPSQLILRGDWAEDDMWLIDPANGATLDDHILEVWLKGDFHSLAELDEEILTESTHEDVVCTFLRSLKQALAEEGQSERALRVIETLLQLNPDHPVEIRDRGLIYAQLGCTKAALHDLRYFMAKCPYSPDNEMITAQITLLSQQSVTLH